ncbi:MAG: cob(I)yrinic acid a,c-diamide adenosyltransferase, partial [bacterium]|nr:cob(I)yrinic acid a,c-diamide adenosyltransferase [bacterium]
MKNSGRILIFTGEGKGKTTAALGMAFRACGHGMQALVIQFIKNEAGTGEIAAGKHLPGLEIIQTGQGFVPPETDPQFSRHQKAAQEGLCLAAEAIKSRKYDLIVLDEICTA